MYEDGWIEWGGGKCPVPPNTWVRVHLRGWARPEEGYTQVSGDAWNHDGGAGDIIFYRVYKEESTVSYEAETNRHDSKLDAEKARVDRILADLIQRDKEIAAMKSAMERPNRDAGGAVAIECLDRCRRTLESICELSDETVRGFAQAQIADIDVALNRSRPPRG